MRRPALLRKHKFILPFFALSALLVVTASIAYIIIRSYADIISNDVRVDENTELSYYLTVKYDGVDRTGVQSSDSTTANIKSGRIDVVDKIPEGLIFNGFGVTSNGEIGAVARSDHATVCSGHVIDDTHDASNAQGTWNAGNTEFTYHGLHYTTSDRTVRFAVENMKAGCELVVQIITTTPTLPNGVSRMDFYNTSSAIEDTIYANSNTVHAWIGNTSDALYTVSYSYTGTIPDGVTPAPSSQDYLPGTIVGVAANAQADGYTFSGWTTSDATVSNSSFTMPSNNVSFVGSFTQNNTPDYSVTYTIEGTAPEGYVVPLTKGYKAGDVVILDSTEVGSVFNSYTFNGWTSNDADLSETSFIMPNKNVVITGSFTKIVHTVSYAFEGNTLPPNYASLLPASAEYAPGDTVTTAPKPSANGYRFNGWYKSDTFTMPDEDVVILGEWSVLAGTFSPTITKTVTSNKDKYRFGDTVQFSITVTNTAAFPINTVQVIERLSGAYFIDNSNYTLRTDQIAQIDTLAAGASVTLYAEYIVQDDETKTVTNTVELTGALASNGYSLDTTKDYTATADFEVEGWQDTPILTGIVTKGTPFFIAIAFIGILGLGASIIVNKNKVAETR